MIGIYYGKREEAAISRAKAIMEGMDQIIQQRIEARKAEAHLKSILEYYVDNDTEYYEMKKHIDEFVEWVWKKSPIA